MSFENHLKEQGYSPKTVHRYAAWERSFLTYFAGRNIAALSQYELLDYLRSKPLSRSSKVLLLGRLRRYYTYLGAPYPLAKFKLKGHRASKVLRVLSRAQVRQLVQVYQQNPRLNTASKVGVGLLAHQGLAVEELRHLQVAHIDLSLGSLTTPEASRLAVRTLPLEASQMLGLSQLLKGQPKAAALFQYKNDRHASNKHQHWKVQIGIELARAGLKFPFINLQQLRTSRITAWIQSEGLLSAQYQAGHHDIGSTQLYHPNQDEGLRRSFERYHPFYQT